MENVKINSHITNIAKKQKKRKNKIAKKSEG